MDWNINGFELRRYYATFGRRRLSKPALYCLARAQAALPEPHCGYMVWLTVISGVDYFTHELQQWAIGLAHHIGAATFRPRRGNRRRAYRFAPTYDPIWGRRAGLDGIMVALFGESSVPGKHQRARRYGCDGDAYLRVRDFVTGAADLGRAQFESALAAALKANGANEDWHFKEQDLYVPSRAPGTRDALFGFWRTARPLDMYEKGDWVDSPNIRQLVTGSGASRTKSAKGK